MLAPMKTGRGFFEVVCPPSSATAHLHDPPPPLDSRTALFKRWNQALEQGEQGCLHPSVLHLSASPTNRLMRLG